jgi:hypothetical protein
VATIRVGVDESGNNSVDTPLLMVGAVEILGDADEVERGIRELAQQLSGRRSLQGTRGFQKFQKSGFHATDDPIEVKTAFLEHMHKVPFRAYIHVTDRSSVHAGDNEVTKISYLYETLIADLLLRFHAEDVLECRIEENDELKKLFKILPETAKLRAQQKSGHERRLPKIDVRVVKKTEYMSIAIIDYVMIAVQHWASSGYSTDRANWQVRAFRDIEPSISILYSLEAGVLSSRNEPLH